MALEAIATAGLWVMREGSGLMRGSLCPHYSRGLPAQGTREAGPVRGFVINLSLSALAAVAEQRGTQPGCQRHKHTREGDKFHERNHRKWLVTDNRVRRIVSSENSIKSSAGSVAPDAGRRVMWEIQAAMWRLEGEGHCQLNCFF